MTHTLELEAEIEQALEVKARQRGLALNAYLHDLARREAEKPETLSDAGGIQQETPEIAPRLAAWHEFIANAPNPRTAAELEALPDEALERESIYEGRGS